MKTSEEKWFKADFFLWVSKNATGEKAEEKF